MGILVAMGLLVLICAGVLDGLNDLLGFGSCGGGKSSRRGGQSRRDKYRKYGDSDWARSKRSYWDEPY